MDYCLPHAVIAFLQEEKSTNLPNSYFISSSTKSTKITLIYARRKSKIFKAVKKRSILDSTKFKSSVTRHRSRSRYSSSSTDDYTKLPSNLERCKYGSCGNNELTRRICASTPGRGFSGGDRPREIGRSAGAAKMAPDPATGSSPNKDQISLSHFAANYGEQDNSDADDNFGIHSPNSVFGDRPPTPGREFNSTSSPRPPTPNASNYASLMSGAKSDLTHSNKRVHQTRSKQSTIEYGNVFLSLPEPQSRLRSNNIISSQSRKINVDSASKITESLRTVPQHLTAENLFFNLHPIALRPHSPAAQSTSTRLSLARSHTKR